MFLLSTSVHLPRTDFFSRVIIVIFSDLEELSDKSPVEVEEDDTVQRTSAILSIKTTQLTDLFKATSYVPMTEAEIEEWTTTIHDTIKSLGK